MYLENYTLNNQKNRHPGWGIPIPNNAKYKFMKEQKSWQ